MIVNARVLSLVNLTESVLQVTLQPDQYIDYFAGQYLEILVDTLAFAYSISNAPAADNCYILHIRHRPENPIPASLLHELHQSKIKIRVPCGECHLNNLESGLSLICIAGGSGIAPIKAMLDQLVLTGDRRSVHLFWSARFQEDFYLPTSVAHWQDKLSDFKSFLQLSDLDQTPLISAVLAQAQPINRAQIVLSGPFEMVYHARDVLIDSGASVINLFADAFCFEQKGE